MHVQCVKIKFRAKWKSQLNQNDEVGVHSSAIIDSEIGTRLYDSPQSGAVSIAGDPE